jgi:isoleucyl-tRNA synthetase
LIEKCRKSFEAYDVRSACRAAEDFLESLSNWYIRNNRRRFWHAELTQDTHDAYETLFECLSTVLRLLAPVLPMLTEACYQNLVKAVLPDAPESVHLTAYPDVSTALLDNVLVEQMDTVARIHQLALSAREKSRLKLRQPLARLLIATANTQEHQAVERFATLLQDGLNVKRIAVLEVGTACPVELRIKPNYRSLGQRFKAKAKAVAQALEECHTQVIEAFTQGSKQFTLEIQSETIMLTVDDVLVEEVDPQSLALVRFDKGWLAFDVELTDELRQEGLMRDVLRQLQVLRKDLGLEIEDRIRVSYQTDSPALRTAIEVHRDFLCDELLCEILTEALGVAGKIVTISGEDIVVSLEKV